MEKLSYNDCRIHDALSNSAVHNFIFTEAVRIIKILDFVTKILKSWSKIVHNIRFLYELTYLAVGYISWFRKITEEHFYVSQFALLIFYNQIMCTNFTWW